MKFFLYILLSCLIGVAVFVFGARTVEQEPSKEWSMPARFEADGAFTLGCSLWDIPTLEPFSEDNPDIAMISLFLNGDRESGYVIQAFIDKRGDGMVLLTGTHCGVSIDWSSFDSQRQKGERPKPGGN